jgi:SAM-dependent methyltransferase
MMAIPNPIPSTQPYWDRAAGTYERDFTGTLLGQTLRRSVWRELDRVFRAGDRVLELNCGTGIDALHLAEHQVTVLACDISQRMIDLARQRVAATRFSRRIDFRVLPTEDLDTLLDHDGLFDGAFSNFSGLNCVEDLGAVRRDLARLLRPGGIAVLCMLGRFVPWEFAWFLAQGDWNKAVRRLRRTECGNYAGAPRVHYYSRREIIRAFAPDFLLRRWKGVGIFLPPSYMDHWAQRFPRTTAALGKADGLLGRVPIVRNMGDFVLLEFERT